jgi:hypothetical protein
VETEARSRVGETGAGEQKERRDAVDPGDSRIREARSSSTRAGSFSGRGEAPDDYCQN